ncbi:shikimate kinase [Hydrogenophaga soli]
MNTLTPSLPDAPTGHAAATPTVVLVGLPGSGKSTVGRQLARRLGVNFVDSDHVIEERLGCSIREYFEREGEQAFRDLEQAVLAELVQRRGIVLSTGGGSVLRPANRQVLRVHGWVVYLKSSPQELFKRLRHDKTRPLLQGSDPLQKLKDLYQVRDPLYREVAHHSVETGRPSVHTLVNHIAMQLEQRALQQPGG